MLDISNGTVKTVDHDEIRDWIEEHDGYPAKLEGRSLTAENLRIEFEAEQQGEETERIPWQDFFSLFEEEGLVFAYQQHSPDVEEERPDHQKYELKRNERGAMQEDIETEMDDPGVQSNMKEAPEEDFTPR